MTDFYRTLTAAERSLAIEVFGNTIDYDEIRIYQGQWVDSIDRAHAPNGNIYFPKDYLTEYGYSSLPADLSASALKNVFIHEITHIWQYQNNVNVILTAFNNNFQNYDYQGIFQSGGKLENLTMEQQALFIQHYFMLKTGQNLPPTVQTGAFSSAILTAHSLAEFQAKIPAGYFESPTFKDSLYVMKGEQTGVYANGEGPQASGVDIYEVRLSLVGSDETPILHGHTVGLSYGVINANLIFALMQEGQKANRVAATWDLYNVINKYGEWDSASQTQVYGNYSIHNISNQYGGISSIISKDGVPITSIAYYEGENFQQQVLEILGADGRTDIAEILVADEFAMELFRGEAIEITYPENFVFGYAGGYIGNLVGQQFANDEFMHDILVSSISRTLGQNLGDVLDFLSTAQNSLTESVFDPVFGVNGTYVARPSILEDFLENFQSGIVSSISSKIADELGDTLHLNGVSAEIFEVAAGTITTGIISESFEFLFNNLNSSIYTGVLSGGINFSTPIYDPSFPGGGIAEGQIGPPAPNTTVGQLIEFQVLNALAGFAGNKLAGEIISPESMQAAIFGSVGSAVGIAITTGTGFIGQTAISAALSTTFASAGSFVPVIGTAIGAFVGQILGTALGNLFGGEDVPSSWAKIRFDRVTDDYVMNESWGNNGGNIQIARDMATAVVNGVNSILDLAGGGIRSTAVVPSYQIGMDGDKFVVYANQGNASSFDQSGEAINDAVFHILKNSDIVGGDALLMRAWHNSDATNLYDFKQDLEVAEAFQNFLLNPTAIIAYMLDQPDSELAQSWAAIFKRADELELQKPHEKDLDGSWNELLLARGDIDPNLIPVLEGSNIILVDPETGKETIIMNVIGPGYKIVHVPSTDGSDIIQIVVDGPSIGYVDAGAGNDVIVGSPERDILVGGAGDDEIDGKGGDDWLHGASGNDTVYGNDGNDLVVGGADNDILTDGAGNDTLYGGKGNDKLTSGLGSDSLYGGEGNDILHGSTTNEEDYLYGQEGDDSIYAYGHHNHLVGGQGNDTLNIISGTHTLKFSRGDGHDTIILADNPNDFHVIDFGKSISPNELWFQRSGESLVIKVIGEDQSITVKDWFLGVVANRPSIEIRVQDLRFQYNGSKDLKSYAQNLVNFYASFTSQPTGVFNVLEDSIFSQGSIKGYLRSQSQSIVFAPTNPSSMVTEYLWGTSANNSISANGSSDRAAGGAGNDTILGGTVDNSNTFFGDSGNDTIKGGFGRDLIYGGLGDDSIWGDTEEDALYGNYGNDIIYGGDANDVIEGGAGSDTLDGGNGNDTISGGDGNDIITDTDGVNTAYGNGGDDTLTFGSGNDTLYAGDGNDIVYGGAGNDLMLGGSGDDRIEGGDGDDTISGEDGKDTLLGGNGKDTIEAGSGNDLIVHDVNLSSLGDDVYRGGEGTDKLQINLSSIDFANATIYSAIRDIAHYIENTKTQNLSGVFQSQGLGISVQSIEELDIYVAGIKTSIAISNTRPYTVDDTYLLEENRVVLIDPLENDSDFEGDAFSLISISNPSYGTAAINNDGTITYRPTSQSFYGADVFSYLAQDSYGEKSFGYINIYFSKAAESVIGTSSDNIMNGTSSIDKIFSKEGNDTVSSLGGDDFLYGMSGNDTLSGGTGNDTIDGGEGNDSLLGGDGNDILFGGSGNDDIRGEVGNDLIYMSYGSDLLNGGDGIDTINGNRLLERVSIDLSVGSAVTSLIHASQLSNIENIIGSQYSDILIGSSASNDIQGGDGNDEVRGQAGNDTIQGGNGNDLIYGGDGNDVLYGNDGDDVFYSDVGNDSFYGGAGWDKLYFTGNGVSVDLRLTSNFSDGHGFTDKISTDFEEVYGSSKGDTIRGQDAVNNIIRGNAGNDILDGNGGDDFIEGGGGDDTLQGGTGIDTVTYEHAASGVILNLITGASQDGDGGKDTFSSLENAIGSSFGDTMTGDGYNNILKGLDGNDTIKGGGGNDYIDGGIGSDMLYGEAGGDTFRIDVNSGSVDTIADFNISQGDKLDIKNILFGYDPLSTAITDFIEITNSGTNSIIKIDRDGLGTAYSWQQVAQISNVTNLTDEQNLVNNGTVVL